MYKVEKDQVGFRLTGDDKEMVNAAMATIQQETGKPFEGFRDFVLHLITENNRLVKQLQTAEINYQNSDSNNENLSNQYDLAVSRITELENELKTAVVLKENERVIQQSEYFTNAYNEYLKWHGTISEGEFETILAAALKKASRPPIRENAVIVDVSASEHLLLTEIGRRRYEKGCADRELLPAETVKQIVFSKATIFNWHGDYRTFIKESEF